jgi:trigger factor
VHTDVKESGPFERTLTVHIEETELESAKGAAARKLSSQMKIKGFRPGKAPRAIVERMVGADTLRREAIDEALPGIVTRALAETDLEPIVTPELEAVRDTDGGVEVDVRITLWPKLDRAPVVEGRKIEIGSVEVEDADVQAQIDRLRDQYAELEEANRPADTGDYAQINLSANRDGAAIEDASVSDLLYEVGSGSFIPGLDGILLGASPGDIRETRATLPEGFGEHVGEEVDLRVLVKGVRSKRLPEVTDEWVSDVTEFDTVAELTGQLRENLGRMKKNAAGNAFQDNLLSEIIDEVDIELPEALVRAEFEAALHNMAHQLEASGIDLANYMRITGQTEQQLVDAYRQRAIVALKTRLVLESVAEAEGLSVEDAEFDEAVAQLAASAREPVDAVRSRLAKTGQGDLLSGDILRRKALDHISKQATPVDAAGNPVDLTVEVEDEEADEPLAGDGADADADQDERPVGGEDDDGGEVPARAEDESP